MDAEQSKQIFDFFRFAIAAGLPVVTYILGGRRTSAQAAKDHERRVNLDLMNAKIKRDADLLEGATSDAFQLYYSIIEMYVAYATYKRVAHGKDSINGPSPLVSEYFDRAMQRRADFHTAVKLSHLIKARAAFVGLDRVSQTIDELLAVSTKVSTTLSELTKDGFYDEAADDLPQYFDVILDSLVSARKDIWQRAAIVAQQ